MPNEDVPAELRPLISHSEKIIGILEDLDGLFLVVSHNDADGISAASQMFKLLVQMEKEFHMKFVKSLSSDVVSEILDENFDVLIILDMGAGYERVIDRHLKNMRKYGIIVDHHKTVLNDVYENVYLMNSWAFGLSGDFEACAASLTFTLLTSYDENLMSMVPFALAGVLGDKQLVNPSGLNAFILRRALDAGIIEFRRGLLLRGNTLDEALTYTMPPYISGITGNIESARKFLKGIGVFPESPVEDLFEDTTLMKKLSSAIAIKLANQEVGIDGLYEVLGPHYFFTIDTHIRYYIEDLTEILDTIGRTRNTGYLPKIVMLDPETISNVSVVAMSMKRSLIESLSSLERSHFEYSTFWYYLCEDPNIKSLVATFGMQYIVPKDKALIVVSKEDDGYSISGRCHSSLVSKGIDLSAALKDVAESFGGFGGGHSVAAGARIPLNVDLGEFLNDLDKRLQEQLKQK